MTKPKTEAKKAPAARKSAAKKPAGKKSGNPFTVWAARPRDSAINELCEYVAEGGHLAGFAKSKGFPYVTMLDWIRRDGERSEMYTRAREDRADVIADEIVAIADEEVTMVKADKHGTSDDDGQGRTEVVFDPTAVARNKLRVDARKWAASKLKPRVYGEKVAIGGASDLPPIRTATDMTDEQLLAIAAQASKKA